MYVKNNLVSNVIQILLILVGQNLQSRHSDLRAENDFEINCKAEREIEAVLMDLKRQQEQPTQLVKAQSLRLDETRRCGLVLPDGGR